MQHNEHTNEHALNAGEHASAPSGKPSFFESKRFHLIVVGALTVLTLLPLWSLRFLPLQDYPQHLLYAHMYHEQNNPALDYSKNFVFHLRAGPYVIFYALTLLFATCFPIEIAGRITMSIYIVAVAALVIKIAHRSKAYPASWIPLLLFPFAFNQQYYLGLMNYLLSLPLLIFALLDHEELAGGASGIRPILRHLLVQTALFFAHPYSFLIYIALALLGALLFNRKSPGIKRAIVMLVLGSVVFSIWFIAVRSASGTFFDSTFAPIRWSPFRTNLLYYSFMFIGMRFFPSPEVISIILWLIVFCVISCAILAAPKDQRIVDKRYLLFFILATAAVFTLPFARYEFTFLNMRFAAISYFLIPVCLADLRLKGVWKWIFIVVIAALVINSAAKQTRISHEVDELVPIIKMIPPNSVILPLVFDNSSPELDAGIFQPHILVHDYYHIRVGGGLNPYVWSQPMHPARYKPGAARPAPFIYMPQQFNWNAHGVHYEYFLLRGAPKERALDIARHAQLVAYSGKWLLFKRKP